MRVFFDFEFIENGAAFVMQPISVGMVKEDGSEYYAEFRNVPWHLANQWVLDNVQPHLTGPLKSGLTIAREIREFVGTHPEFWAYFADYDWVLLCQLYGPMVNLPQGWPFWCRDIKQAMWERGLSKEDLTRNGLREDDLTEHNALSDARWNARAYEVLSGTVTS